MSASSQEKRNALHVLVHRIPDERGRRVVFLSHCLLNENTRYLGGACERGAAAPSEPRRRPGPV